MTTDEVPSVEVRRVYDSGGDGSGHRVTATRVVEHSGAEVLRHHLVGE